jgi:hypothetical protein
MSTLINGITTTTKNYMYMRLGELLQSAFFFLVILHLAAVQIKKKKRREKKAELVTVSRGVRGSVHSLVVHLRLLWLHAVVGCLRWVR